MVNFDWIAIKKLIAHKPEHKQQESVCCVPLAYSGNNMKSNERHTKEKLYIKCLSLADAGKYLQVYLPQLLADASKSVAFSAYTGNIQSSSGTCRQAYWPRLATELERKSQANTGNFWQFLFP